MEQPGAITGAEHARERQAHRNLRSCGAPTAWHGGKRRGPRPTSPSPVPTGDTAGHGGAPRPGGAAPKPPASRGLRGAEGARREAARLPAPLHGCETGGWLSPAQRNRGLAAGGPPPPCRTHATALRHPCPASGHQNRGATRLLPRGAELEQTGTALGLPAPSFPRHKAPGPPQHRGSGSFGD